MISTRVCTRPLIRLWAATAAVGTTGVFAFACGGAGDPANVGTNVDASVPPVSIDGGVAGDDGGGSDAAIAIDAGDFATGHRLVPRPSVLQGMTSDGYVVFSEEAADGGGQVAKVIGIDGGGELTIATGTAADKALRIATSGPVVFVWTNRGDRVATLTVWSKATGAVVKGAGIRPGRGAASSDGAFIAYIDNVATTTADIVVSPIATAAPATVGTLNASDTSCWQNVDLEFAGTPARFLSFFCPTPSTAFTLRSTATNGTSAADLSSAATLETIGKNVVLVAGGDAGLQAFAPDGTHPIAIASNVTSFELSDDESTVAFQSSDDSIGISPVAASAPRTVVAAGKGLQLGPISSDERYVMFASAIGDAGTGQIEPETDVQIASTLDGGTTRALVTTITSCPGCLADSFTRDMTYAMAIDPIDDSQAAGGVGPLRAFPLDGGADTRIGTHVYTAIALDTEGDAGASAQLLFVEATPSAGLSTGYAYELYTRALGPSDAPTEIARGAEYLALDDGRTTVVYSIPGSDDLAGLWVAPLP